jgi:hypothetical protein
MKSARAIAQRIVDVSNHEELVDRITRAIQRERRRLPAHGEEVDVTQEQKLIAWKLRVPKP